MSKIAIIMGAGPAGLSTAYHLLKTTEILPVVLERSDDPNGELSGSNRMSIFPYRILSKLKQYFSRSKNSAGGCEAMAWQVQETGGNIHFRHHIYAIYAVGRQLCSIHAINGRTGELTLFRGDYFFSMAPIHQLMPEVTTYNVAGVINDTDPAKGRYDNLFDIDNRTNNYHFLKTLS